jgi:hypothetical protein
MTEVINLLVLTDVVAVGFLGALLVTFIEIAVEVRRIREVMEEER